MMSNYSFRRLGAAIGAASYMGIAAYCLISLAFGPAGLYSYHRLESRKETMVRRLAELTATQERLRSEFESFQGDSEQLDREARELGYLRPGETFLVIPGIPARMGIDAIPPGEILPFLQPITLPDKTIKEFCLFLGVAVFALSIVRDSRRSPRHRERRVHTASRI